MEIATKHFSKAGLVDCAGSAAFFCFSFSCVLELLRLTGELLHDVRTFAHIYQINSLQCLLSMSSQSPILPLSPPFLAESPLMREQIGHLVWIISRVTRSALGTLAEEVRVLQAELNRTQQVLSGFYAIVTSLEKKAKISHNRELLFVSVCGDRCFSGRAWHSFLTYYLTFLLTFLLTYLLTFLSDILFSDIANDMSSDISPDISSGTLFSHSFLTFFSDISSDMSNAISSDISSDIPF